VWPSSYDLGSLEADARCVSTHATGILIFASAAAVGAGLGLACTGKQT
jgi:hypothetical protein